MSESEQAGTGYTITSDKRKISLRFDLGGVVFRSVASGRYTGDAGNGLGSYPELFMNDPPNAAFAVAYPSGLHEWLSTTRMWDLGAGCNGTDWRSKERKVLSDVMISLARELYIREHGEPPESNEDLVGRYLERLPEEAIPSGDTPASR